MGFSCQEQDRIIRSYYRTVADDEGSFCPSCGELLRFELRYPRHGEVRVEVSCPDCGEGFEWRQTRPVQPFKRLHLEYFLERREIGEQLRCPIDDCAVATLEFSDGVLEFRCPYCNRRGRIPPEQNGNQLVQLT